MQTLLERLKKDITEKIQALPHEGADSEVAEITPSTSPQFGHYQCNSALKLRAMLPALSKNLL